MAPPIRTLPYTVDSAQRFEALAARPWSVFLDSGGRGRYDILASDPATTLVTRAGITEISDARGTRRSQDDPLELLREYLMAGPDTSPQIPFDGGAIGYFGYDLARSWLGLPPHPSPDPAPEMAVGVYRWALVVDHVEQKVFLAGADDPGAANRVFTSDVEDVHGHPLRLRGRVHADLSEQDYRQCFDAIQNYLRAGDCYQVNLAQRFSAHCDGDPWRSYRRLRSLSPAPSGAYLNLPQMRVLSNSPELFLSLRNRQVVTRPIKGTRPRDLNPARDAELAAELAASRKDRSENLMIVDLLRNDLSKNCTRVRVPELFKLESFATVHHLVSTVTGNLREGRDALDLLRGCLPGGSVTGAPKRRAMQIIDELEPAGRGVYCGAIGYIGFNGNMETSIGIRTAVYDGTSMRFWAGGGIVAESEWDAEYRECLTKAEAMFRTLTDTGAAVAAS